MFCVRPESEKSEIDRRRLARCLLLSLFLHGALLTVNDRQPASKVSRQMFPLALTWTAPTAPRENTGAPIDGGTAQHSMTSAKRKVASTSESASTLPTDGSIHDLLENARQTARDEALRIERQGKTDSPRQDAPENRLARALARPAAQERLLANGTYKITTSAGTTYCLNEPPDFNRGGLSTALRVASTCP
ncbi:MAG: hypothetical protein WAZ34_02390 [Rhodocyclaceae bacterium]